jgi:hypothetical protein
VQFMNVIIIGGMSGSFYRVIGGVGWTICKCV